jgi:hypothetical protein
MCVHRRSAASDYRLRCRHGLSHLLRAAPTSPRAEAARSRCWRGQEREVVGAAVPPPGPNLAETPGIINSYDANVSYVGTSTSSPVGLTPGGTPPPGTSEPPPGTSMTSFQWTGEISPQKWMNFYTKVLSRFATAGGLKLTVTANIEPPGGDSVETGGDEGGAAGAGSIRDLECKRYECRKEVIESRPTLLAHNARRVNLWFRRRLRATSRGGSIAASLSVVNVFAPWVRDRNCRGRLSLPTRVAWHKRLSWRYHV